MAEQVNKPISALTELTSFSGNEKVPLAIGMASNRSARLSYLREYFKDSTVVAFYDIDYSEVYDVGDETLYDEENSLKDVVYVATKKIFAERKTKASSDGNNTYSYSTKFNRWEDFLEVVDVEGVSKKVVRSDKVFFNTSNGAMYTFNGELNNFLDSVKIITMTEEEFGNIQHPIEGAIYGIFEEE